MKSTSSLMQRLVELIPAELEHTSGSVFYSGTEAFSSSSPLYVLGLNPGGDPIAQSEETIRWHTNRVLKEYPRNWSAYRDESWRGKKPGSYGMAPRILHLFDKLSLDSGQVPCSNLIFKRTRREQDIKQHKQLLADQCWPFHAHVIENQEPSLILCFGATVGKYVCGKLDATELAGEFVERNNRRWKSRAFKNTSSQTVVVATHPSIANWTAPNTDPSALVAEALE
ncbi:hypothetical protein [Salinisphaera orenii]|uniref:hypothetical protein n=1 Tax=Salinisphaera orenii TaxID=856731 RepID=UPI0011CDACE2|nr:hypothetical protein [Salinisphaera halophila]